MVKSFATVVLSTAIILIWLHWSVGVQFILLVFVAGSIMLHLSLCARIVQRRLQELASAGARVSAMQTQRRTIRRQLIQTMA